MVKYNNEWGTICKDDFTSISGESACHALGLSYDWFTYRQSQTSPVEGDTTRIWMGDIHCEFLECPQKSKIVNYYSDSKRDCSHSTDVVLICT